MYMQETAEQEALRQSLREYFAQLTNGADRETIGRGGRYSPEYRALIRQMGTDGWLGIGWPVEYGGQGRPATDQFIFFDEACRADIPFPFISVNTVGPTLIRQGTEEQKQHYLPAILAGEIDFAVGYTEPDAGTDLASLRTSAVRDGDDWVINGNKVYTSGAPNCDYIWLACRTDPDAPKHKGISIILVPTTSTGYSWTPIVTVGNDTTTATFYDNVRVPATNLVGVENEGWRLITSQLNHERVGLAAMGGRALQIYADVVEWAKHEGLLERPWVQLDVARCHALLGAMNLLNWRVASGAANGTLTAADSSAVKVFGTEASVEVYRLLLGVVGAAGTLRSGSPGAVIAGRLERAGRAAQINTFGGGVNDVQRDIISAVALGMGRANR